MYAHEHALAHTCMRPEVCVCIEYATSFHVIIARHAQGLHCNIAPLPKDSREYKLITEYIAVRVCVRLRVCDCVCDGSCRVGCGVRSRLGSDVGEDELAGRCIGW